MIKHVEPEKAFLVLKVFSVFPQANVEGGRSVVRPNENLLFENDAILGWHILVSVL